MSENEQINSPTEQESIRRDKLKSLQAYGFNFPNNLKITAHANDILNKEISPNLEECLKVEKALNLAGRIVQSRFMGKAAFFHLLDRDGKIQIYVKSDVIGGDEFTKCKDFDLGDIVYCEGQPFITKTGEKSLYVQKITLLTKSLVPLPEKYHGLTDIEARYRQRYVDLISNFETREVFKTRAKIIQFIRNFLDQRDYVEVETPVLHHIASGATAKPFKTHYNSLHADMNLRIALELPLKKLIVGGLDRVYEIGRVFRNEGLSKKHNPEFTMLEFYEAHSTYFDLMNLTEELISSLVKSLHGSYQIKYLEHELDFTPPWKKISMVDSIYEYGKISRDYNLDKLEDALKVAQENKIHINQNDRSDWGRIVEELWGELVEPKLINPVFITQHPFSISPLARKNDENPVITDRFELIIAGMEMANAFSELNDAIDQRERFEAQADKNKKGDDTAPQVEEDFLRALEYGMPPTAGEGIGIDRLTMLLTNSNSIRDVVLFPQLKVTSNEQQAESQTPSLTGKDA